MASASTTARAIGVGAGPSPGAGSGWGNRLSADLPEQSLTSKVRLAERPGRPPPGPNADEVTDQFGLGVLRPGPPVDGVADRGQSAGRLQHLAAKCRPLDLPGPQQRPQQRRLARPAVPKQEHLRDGSIGDRIGGSDIGSIPIGPAQQRPPKVCVFSEAAKAADILKAANLSKTATWRTQRNASNSQCFILRPPRPPTFGSPLQAQKNGSLSRGWHTLKASYRLAGKVTSRPASSVAQCVRFVTNRGSPGRVFFLN